MRLSLPTCKNWIQTFALRAISPEGLSLSPVLMVLLWQALDLIAAGKLVLSQGRCANLSKRNRITI
jgi:hypothetical protein